MHDHVTLDPTTTHHTTRLANAFGTHHDGDYKGISIPNTNRMGSVFTRPPDPRMELSDSNILPRTTTWTKLYTRALDANDN